MFEVSESTNQQIPNPTSTNDVINTLVRRATEYLTRFTFQRQKLFEVFSVCSNPLEREGQTESFS